MTDVRALMDVTINAAAVTSGAPFAPLDSRGRPAFSQLVGFGDSSIDTGFFLTHPTFSQSQSDAAVAAGGGALETDIGSKINTTSLAGAYGLSAIPIGEPGGTNYAASGATVSNSYNGNPVYLHQEAPDIVSQIGTYLSTHQSLDPNTLFYIAGGSNSATYAGRAFPDDSNGTSHFADRQNFMMSEAHKLSAAIETLYQAGGRYFVIDSDSAGSALGTTFSQTLWSDLSQYGISFVSADDHSQIVAMTHSPSSYGLVDVRRPADGPYTPANPYDPTTGGDINPDPSTFSAGWARFATQEQATNADRYLYADDVHLGGRAQLTQGDYTYNAIQYAHPLVGTTLTANALTVPGLSAGTISYQWQTYDPTAGTPAWTDISRQTNSTYTVQAGDVGHQLRVKVFGSNGGQYAATSPATQTIASLASLQAPGLPSLVDATSDTGVSNNDNITDNATPTLTGAARPGATVTVYDGQTSIGTALANVAGSWFFTPQTALAEGTHTISVSDSLNGDSSPLSGGRVVTIDTTAPVLNSASVNGATLTLTYDSLVETGLPLELTHPDPKTPATAFSVLVDGNSDQVSGVAFDTNAHTVTLTLASAVTSNQSVTVGYTIPNEANGVGTRRAIQDIAGNDAAAFSNYAVTNATAASGGITTTGTSGGTTTVGTSGNDSITAGDGANTIFGGQGNDTITAGDGGNIIVGGDDSNDGADLITSGTGNDLIFGNGGDDTISSNGGNDIVVGGVGNDLVTLGAGNDLVYGNEGNDTINAGDGSNTVAAGQGDDQVTAGSGNDLIFGNEGADTINAGDGDNVIVGGQDSNDGADALSAGSGNDLIFGNGGDDTINGGDGQNSLVGGYGNDAIAAGSGNDVIFGNQGNDTINAGDGANLVFGGFGDDLITAGAGNDTLYGNEGNDTLNGGAGADRYVFNPGDGNDLVQGFSSANGDLLDLMGQTYAVTQDANGNAVLTLSGGGTITLAGVASSQVSSAFFA